MPSLAISLTLNFIMKDTQYDDGRVSKLVTFISGLLLGSNTKVRSWFASFIKTTQDVRVISGYTESLFKYLFSKNAVKSSQEVHPVRWLALFCKVYPCLAFAFLFHTQLNLSHYLTKICLAWIMTHFDLNRNWYPSACHRFH